MPSTIQLETRTVAGLDVASGTARANRNVWNRISPHTTYLGAVTGEIGVIASCIADDVLKGQQPYKPWLAEYVALCCMRDRAIAAFDQQHAARIEQVAEWKRGDQARTKQLAAEQAGTFITPNHYGPGRVIHPGPWSTCLECRP